MVTELPYKGLEVCEVGVQFADPHVLRGGVQKTQLPDYVVVRHSIYIRYSEGGKCNN